jgi:methionyl-tRNA formyltransferase
MSLNIVFMGKDKPVVGKALLHLSTEHDHTIKAVVIPDDAELHELSKKLELPTYNHNSIYGALEHLGDIDLVISFLYWRKIKPSLIKLPRLGCINFHPAPLPEYRGVGGYASAILHDKQEFGVTVHHVSEGLDEGDLIEVSRFPIDCTKETAFSLEKKTMEQLYSSFISLMSALTDPDYILPRTPQGEGTYTDIPTRESWKKVTALDSAEDIDRKIRAFWFPPYTGAQMEHNGSSYTIVNDFILEDLANTLKQVFVQR